jgi:hypothetical protein
VAVSLVSDDLTTCTFALDDPDPVDVQPEQSQS